MYSTKYILPFTNNLGEFYEIYFDYLTDIPFAIPITLTGANDCLIIKSTSGDETKLTYILGSEATIKIAVDELTPLSISDFVVEQANAIRVTVYKDQDYTKSYFQGFVMVEDNSQAFQDAPFTLEIHALDGLGLLKGVDLVDTNNTLFVGSMSIVQWIAQMLYKTNQTLNIRTYFNFYNSSFSEGFNSLVETKLNAILFNKALVSTIDPSVDVFTQEADDCYTALEKIAKSFRCRLFQQDGVWNLVNLYEYLNPEGYTYFEYEMLDPVDGIVQVNTVGGASNITYDVPIGKKEIIHSTNDDAALFLKLATKWVDLTYNYDQSSNKICNQDLTQGNPLTSFDEVISSSIIDSSINPVADLNTYAYEDFCFDHFNGGAVSTAPDHAWAYPSSPADKTAFIRVVRDVFGYETFRYLVIPTTAINQNVTYVRTNRILIDQNDIFQLSFSIRNRVSPGPGPATTVWVYLYGDDGTFWTLHSYEGSGGVADATNPKWIQVDSNFKNVSGVSPAVLFTYDDYTAWNSASINQNPQFFAKTPVSGSIEVLFAGYRGAIDDPVEYWYKDIRITIVPILLGTYREVKGDFNYSSSSNNIKQTLKEDVYISDSPKRYFKGALLNADGETLSPPSWHRKGKIAVDGNTIELPIIHTPFFFPGYRFTQCMERIMYNHLYRVLQKIEGSFRGIVFRDNLDFTITRQSGLLNTYYFVDHDTPDKKFMCTSYEINYCTGAGRRVFVETLRDSNDDGWANPSDYAFQYIFK